MNLENQRVKIGESLLYSPGIQLNTYGYLMDVRADLGAANRFTEFDSERNTFKVHSNLLTKSDIGIYIIKISAKFYSENYEENFRGEFLLTVWDDPEKDADPWFPPDPIEYQFWDGSIREDAKLGPYDPLQPIPYIVDLSRTGLMTIGWDRVMVPPGNYTVIPQA